MEIKEQLEIIGYITGIIAFFLTVLFPFICKLLKGKIMPAVKKEISNAITDNNKNNEKQFKYSMRERDDNIINIARAMVRDEISESEEQKEKERLLRSETYIERIENIKTLFKRNEAQRVKDNEMIFGVLDSIKNELNSLSKMYVAQQGVINESANKIKQLERNK